MPRYGPMTRAGHPSGACTSAPEEEHDLPTTPRPHHCLRGNADHRAHVRRRRDGVHEAPADHDADPTARHQRLPRQPRPAAGILRRRDPAQRRRHHHERRRRRRRISLYRVAAGPRRAPEHRYRVGRRQHRREPAALGGVPRRADDPGAQQDGRLRRHRRQPRVRRGLGRAAAHAVRRLPHRRRLLQPRPPVPRRELPVSRRERHQRQDAPAAAAAVLDQEHQRCARRLHRRHAAGHPRHRHGVGRRRSDLQGRGLHDQLLRQAPQAARRERDRRARAPGRHPDEFGVQLRLQRRRSGHRPHR